VAPVLLCPECGTKHPLDDVTSDTSFPCSGCGRTLKVPAQARQMTAAAAEAASAPTPITVAPPPPAARPVPPPTPAPQSTQVVAAVPPAAAATAAAAAPAGPPLGQPQGVAGADLARDASTPPTSSTAASVPPVWMRILLWIVAVPLAFLVVFGLARAFGFLATNDITDIALADGFHRYWPIVRLLPFVALATALFVTGGVYGIARLRARNEPPAGSTGSGRSASAKSRRPVPRQSSRTGA
jgi:hypothetical protein